MLIGITKGNLIPLPVVSFEFCPTPKKTAPTLTVPNIILRSHRVGERMDPVWYHTNDLPPYTGRLDATQWRGSPSPVFMLLGYQGSPEFRISRQAVNIIDEYAGKIDITTGQIRL